VLGGAAHGGTIWGEPASSMRAHQILVDHRQQVSLGESLDFRHLVGGAETVEEVQKGHPRAQRCRVRDQCQVLRLLDASRRQQRPSRLSYRHHVLVVAEDTQALRGDRPRGDVETVDVSSPAILYMLGIISSRPWDAVKVVVSEPVDSAMDRAGGPGL